MRKNYDVLLLPTGEKVEGDGIVFPVSKMAVNVYNSGRVGCIYVSGGHGGFSVVEDGTRSEADVTRDFLLERKIPDEKIYCDGSSLDTMGNFTFPIVNPVEGNPGLLDFGSMVVLGQEGHMWRARDYASLVFPEGKMPDFHAIPGSHNNGVVAMGYHSAFMNALMKIRKPDAEKVHDFLLNRHPFYSEGWYEKSPRRRKLEMVKTGVDWWMSD